MGSSGVALGALCIASMDAPRKPPYTPVRSCFFDICNFVLFIFFSESPNWDPQEVYPDSEPWALGGGLLPDMQKLVIASPKVGEIFTVKYAIPLSLTCYTILPVDLLNIDKVQIPIYLA